MIVYVRSWFSLQPFTAYVFQSLYSSSSDSGSGSQEKHYSVPRNLPALQPHSDLSFKDASGHHPSGKHNIDIRSNTDGHF